MHQEGNASLLFFLSGVNKRGEDKEGQEEKRENKREKDGERRRRSEDVGKRGRQARVKKDE